MIRVLVLLVALLAWCPPAFAQELANLHIVVDAEPGTPRTEALLALLRTRFTRVDVGDPAIADVVVLDRWEGVGERRSDRSWSISPRPHKPHVVLGGAARGAIPAWNLLGARPAEPVEGPTERRDPGSTRPGPELGERLFADGYAPLAFALFEAPDAHVALATRDGSGRPLAVVWHQGAFVFFGPGAAADELGEEWSDVLLRCVAYAGGFWRSVGNALAPGAPGADARGEVAWRLSGESPSAEGLGALVSDPTAPSSDDAEEWSAWFSRNGPYLVSDEEGRLHLDAGLLAFDVDPSSPEFLERVVARLAAESPEERSTARRLLGRHAEHGAGVYASRAEWEAWIEKERRTLVYGRSDQRWRTDWAQGSRSTLFAWDRAPMFREGGRSFHAVDPRMEVHVPGGDGPPSLLRVPYIWSLPPEAAADALVRWLQQSETVAERELVLRNMAELGPDASLVAEAVADWFEGASPELVVRVLAAGGPATFDSFLKAAKLGEEIARAAITSPIDPDGPIAAALGKERARTLNRPFIDLAGPVDVLVRHPAADGPFLGRVAAAAAALPEGHWQVLREALLGGLARDGAPSDPSWIEPLTKLVERHGSLHTPNLLGALVRHGDARWVEDVRGRLATLEGEGLELPAREVAAVAGMGSPGVELVLELARKGTPAWRSELATHVDLALLAAHRPPREWLASDADIELVVHAVVRRWKVHPHWYEALIEAAVGDDDRTAVPALEAAGRVLSSARSWPLLEGALAHPSHWRRRAAAHAIATFHAGTDDARDALLAAIHDTDAWVRAAALWALREPAGSRDATVIARLEAVATGPSPLAPIARHSLYRRTVSDTPLLDAVHALPDPIVTIASAQRRDGDDEQRRRVEHELRNWVDHLWERDIDWDTVGESSGTMLLARLGEAALLEIERSRPFAWRGNAFAFEGHNGIVRAMGMDGWPLLAGMIWGRQVPLNVPVFVWPEVPGASAWLATMLAQRESFLLSVGMLGMVVGRVDLEDSTKRWRTLGDPGRAALAELEQHPVASVRAHARAVLDRLDAK